MRPMPALVFLLALAALAGCRDAAPEPPPGPRPGSQPEPDSEPDDEPQSMASDELREAIAAVAGRYRE
ncbi:MAG: hypothetical protein GY711_33380 [bacterium]|nr:hypothetical protein [bacterium]